MSTLGFTFVCTLFCVIHISVNKCSPYMYKECARHNLIFRFTCISFDFKIYNFVIFSIVAPQYPWINGRLVHAVFIEVDVNSEILLTWAVGIGGSSKWRTFHLNGFSSKPTCVPARIWPNLVWIILTWPLQSLFVPIWSELRWNEHL